MVRCCVNICKSDSTKHNVRFHSFPKNPDVFKKWIEKTNLISLEDKITPYNYFKVCREHFKFSDYISDKHLKKGTVPSLNLEIPIFIKEHDYCVKGSIVSKDKECYSNQTSDKNLQDSILIDSNATNSNIQCFDSPKSLKTSAMNELYEEPNVICEESVVEVDLEEESVTEYNLVESLEKEFQDSLSSVISEHSVDSDSHSNQNTSGQHLGTAGVTEKIFEPNQKTKSKRPYNSAARKQRYYASKVRFLKEQLKSIKKSNPTWDRSKMTKAQVDFIEMQIRNSSKHKNGRRYKLNEKSMLLGMFKRGPKSFRSFSKVILLPTKQTLTKHASRTHAHFQPGINANLMKFMKETASKMTAKERMCCISWDEVALAPELHYSKSTDSIEGFVDVGEGSGKDFTNHALTFMVRGIAKPFKQSIAYFLTSPHIKGQELAELIILVIEAILKTGLVVVISVCDQIAINITAINYLISRGYSVKKNSNGQLIQYTIDNYTITHIYDAGHVIKGVRNNMLTKNLTHFESPDEPLSEEKKTASWTDVKDFYGIYQKSSSQLLTNITDEHIRPNQLKMKTSLATQIFSKTFGSTMKNYSKANIKIDFSGTADILIFFDEVFDSINGAGDPIQNSIKGSISRSSSHLDYWQCAISAIEKMEWVIKEKDENETATKKKQPNEGKKIRKQPQVGDICRRSKVLENIVSTLKGLIFITEKLLNEGFEHFSPRRLNSDGLENYFGNAKSICLALKSPSPRQFKSSFSTLFFDNSLSLHSTGSNCEKDDDVPLLQSTTLLQVNESVVDVARDINFEKENVDDDETNQLSPAYSYEDEAISYTAGRISKTMKAKVKCPNCISTLESSNEDYAMADPFNKPSCQLLSIVKNTVTRVEKILPSICFEKKLSNKIVGLIENDFIIGCDEHKKELTKILCTTLVELLIHAYVRRVNAILKGKVDVINEDDEVQKSALAFRRSKKHIGKYAPQADLIND